MALPELTKHRRIQTHWDRRISRADPETVTAAIRVRGPAKQAESKLWRDNMETKTCPPKLNHMGAPAFTAASCQGGGKAGPA